jgi:anti-sigma factor RsiW
MHTDPLDEWIELQRQRPLRPDERERLRSCLARNPPLRKQWEQELALTRLLRDLPDAPVPPHFNATVRAAVQRATTSTRFIDWFLDWIRSPRPATGALAGACALLLLLGGLGYNQHQSYHRARMASSVADISRSVEIAAVAAQLAPAEILRDFEVIYRLSQVRPQADEELLAALQ